MDKYPCGCKIGKLGKYQSIDYCKMHEAAYEMLEALERVMRYVEPESSQWEAALATYLEPLLKKIKEI